MGAWRLLSRSTQDPYERTWLVPKTEVLGTETVPTTGVRGTAVASTPDRSAEQITDSPLSRPEPQLLRHAPPQGIGPNREEALPDAAAEHLAPLPCIHYSLW